MKWFKRILIAFGILLLLAIIGIGLFVYKAQHGFATYETDPPDVEIPNDKPAILLFSKTTAFRHGEAIDAAKAIIDSLSKTHNWYVYDTEKAGIFNEDQLHKFDLVIWNNSTGPVLTENQRELFQSYIANGGGYLGIHGAGDFSHKWAWYTNNLISADFSHHPIKKHIQPATVYLSEDADSIWQTPPLWMHNDEWYVFHESPASKNARVLYWIDGTSIDPSGNLLFISDKDFGMGKNHPVSWYQDVGKGRSFYTSMGHNAPAIQNKNFVQMLKGAIDWAGKIE